MSAHTRVPEDSIQEILMQKRGTSKSRGHSLRETIYKQGENTYVPQEIRSVCHILQYNNLERHITDI